MVLKSVSHSTSCYGSCTAYRMRVGPTCPLPQWNQSIVAPGGRHELRYYGFLYFVRTFFMHSSTAALDRSLTRSLCWFSLTESIVSGGATAVLTGFHLIGPNVFSTQTDKNVRLSSPVSAIIFRLASPSGRGGGFPRHQPSVLHTHCRIYRYIHIHVIHFLICYNTIDRFNRYNRCNEIDKMVLRVEIRVFAYPKQKQASTL